MIVKTATSTTNTRNLNQATVFNRMIAEPGTEPRLLLGNETAGMIDFFGENFSRLMENYVSQSAPVISQSYLKTLGKIEITGCSGYEEGKICFNNSTILVDATVQLDMELPGSEKKHIRFSCVPASFSPVMEGSLVSGIVVRCDEYCQPLGASGTGSGGGAAADPVSILTMLAATAKKSTGEDKPVVLLTRRGGISFAQKALIAQRYVTQGVRVAAVVVVQSSDKWPFVMADSAREIHSNTNIYMGSANMTSNTEATVNTGASVVNPSPAVCLSIPVVMISKHDGELLEEYLMQRENHQYRNPSGTGTESSSGSVTQLSVQMNSKLNECSICQELMDFPQCRQCCGNSCSYSSPTDSSADGNASTSSSANVAVVGSPMEIYKLPCNHCYHVDCVTQWLILHNTCPMCRYKCPAEAVASSSATAATPVSSGAGEIGDMYV